MKKIISAFIFYCFPIRPLKRIIGISTIVMVSTLFITHYSLGQWYQLNSGTSVNLNKIQFVNSQTGWAGGYQSFVTQYVLLKTTNGGLNWINQIANFPYGNRVISLFFTDINTGWITGAEGIYKTTNGGENYFTITNPSSIVYDCYFVNPLTGWTVGLESGTKVARTTNGGNNWTQQTVNIGTEQLYYVYFVNENTGWCTGPNSLIKTTNGGVNWFSQSHPAVSLINRIFAISPEVVWVTASGTVLTTTNGGSNWISRDIGTNYYAMSAYFLNSNTGYVCTSPRNIFKTTNNGLNWIAQMTDTVSIFNSIYFTSSDTGYVCGSSGKIYKTYNGGAIGIKPIGENIPEEFSLYQNYPNPFNPNTIIRFQIKDLRFVTLKVYDILGKEVATLVNEKQSPGVYEVSFDGSQYTSGVYFYQLSIDNVQYSIKKMLMIK
jgi:photosystem II stability/assembly factor-like uncharacterized protein